MSKAVDKEEQGEALGALNGLKALTEGIGPLVFGVLMHSCEDSVMPVRQFARAHVAVVFNLLLLFTNLLLLSSDHRERRIC